MLRILVVDDSTTACAALRFALESDRDLTVVAEAHNGAEALAAIERHDPDLVTMDVHLERENGLDVAARIMEIRPRPILIITGVAANDPELAFRALAAGALEVRPKLPSVRSLQYETERRRLLRLVRALSGVPVVTRRARRRRQQRVPPTAAKARPSTSKAVLIGASTGGPPLLQELLRALPNPLGVPVVVAQHIFKGFADGLARWLADTTPHPVVVCHEDQRLEPDTVYLAPGDRHIVLRSDRVVGISSAPPRRHQRPSIDELFESAAAHLGESTIAVLLSGMGQDGAAGLAILRRSGALTIVQEPATCVIESMPRAAIQAAAAELVLRPEEIALELRRRVGTEL